MSDLKYKQSPPSPQNAADIEKEKAEIKIIQEQINKLMQNQDNVKKAAHILEEWLKKSPK